MVPLSHTKVQGRSSDSEIPPILWDKITQEIKINKNFMEGGLGN